MNQTQATDIYLGMTDRRVVCELAAERYACQRCKARAGQVCTPYPRLDSAVLDFPAHAGRWMEHLMTATPYESPDITAGAIQYVKCSFCASPEGQNCRIKLYQGGQGTPLPDFAHIARRMEYVEWRDVLGEPTRPLPVEAAIQEDKKFHAYVEKTRPCSKPRRHCSQCSQCECGAPLADHVGKPAEPVKSSSNVDDLLG